MSCRAGSWWAGTGCDAPRACLPVEVLNSMIGGGLPRLCGKSAPKLEPLLNRPVITGLSTAQSVEIFFTTTIQIKSMCSSTRRYWECRWWSSMQGQHKRKPGGAIRGAPCVHSSILRAVPADGGTDEGSAGLQATVFVPLSLCWVKLIPHILGIHLPFSDLHHNDDSQDTSSILAY